MRPSQPAADSSSYSNSSGASQLPASALSATEWGV